MKLLVLNVVVMLRPLNLKLSHLVLMLKGLVLTPNLMVLMPKIFGFKGRF